jgi:DNA polymerase-1
MAKLMLIDGNSLTYRAFFALPADMATASGQVTNAVYGFTSMLTILFKDHKPDQVAVAFDRPEPTFRHETVKDYKAGRAETPDILRQQMGVVKEVVQVLGLTMIDKVGFEADDVIATLATQARDRGDDVIIVTGDRDSYQLVEDPHVQVLYNKRGVSDYALYDEAGILERTGVRPVDYPQYAALRGDPSDNLPGVPGVGEKTAAKLINDYHSIDGIYDNLDKLTPKLRQSLADAKEQVYSNAQATVLVRDVPLDEFGQLHEPAALDFGAVDLAAAKSLFDFLEFKTLWDRLAKVHPSLQGVTPKTQHAVPVAPAVDVVVLDASSAPAALQALSEGDCYVVATWSGEPGRSNLRGLTIAGSVATSALWLSDAVLRDSVVAKLLSTLRLVGCDTRDLLRGLKNFYAVDAMVGFDVSIAAYLVDPASGGYDLAHVAMRFAEIALTESVAQPQGQFSFDQDQGDSDAELASASASHVDALRQLHPILRDRLVADGMLELYQDIENPLISVLAKMEVVGVGVDKARLTQLAEYLTGEVARLEAEVHKQAGHPFVVNSTKQLQVVLFEELGLAPQKKTKTGYSTDAQSLEKLVDDHPIIPLLLKYREVEKLRSTYGTALLAEVGADGRIHASFSQTVARTGRLSSEHPNLHNIPVRSEEGKRFRECFVPQDGWLFCVADYNQIELRVIAHLAHDPGLVEAFRTGQDIHTATAARVFDVEPSDVTSAQRAKAKMVSYGLAYGMEAYGLAQRLSIPVGEADQILKAYFAAFPAIRQYMDDTVAAARSRGYTETLFGRRRQIPELLSDNFRIRQAGERQAMNAGIQGLAADIFKVALVNLDRALVDARLQSRIILQVHDEIIVEVPEHEKDQVQDLTLAAMRGAAELSVPLEVNLGWGASWAAK